MKTRENTISEPPNEELISLKSEIDKLKEENTVLREQLAWLTRQVFGKKSEKEVDISEQLHFPELQTFFATEEEEEKEVEPTGKPPRKKPKRDGQDAIKIPSDIPVT